MRYFITLQKKLKIEDKVLYVLSIMIAVSCVYTKQFFSLLLPIITILVIKQQGKIERLPILTTPPLLILLLLLALGGVSSLWSIVPKSSIMAFVSASLTFAFAYVFMSALSVPNPDLFKKVNRILILSVVLLSPIFIYQTLVSLLGIKYLATFIDITIHLKPYGSVLGLAIFVICAYSWVSDEKPLAVSMFVILAMLIHLSMCQTADYSLILSVIVFAISYVVPRWTTIAAVFFTFYYMSFAPFIFTYIFYPAVLNNSPSIEKLVNSSLYHRMLGWEFYSYKIFERPFLGWGAESSRHIYDNPELAKGFANLLHPHNASIQGYLEMGIVGGILMSLLFPSLFMLVLKKVRDPLCVAVCNATLAFAFIAAEVTHNIWHSYWLSWSALVAGLVILFVKTREAQLHEPIDRSQPALSH